MDGDGDGDVTDDSEAASGWNLITGLDRPVPNTYLCDTGEKKKTPPAT